MIHEATYEYGLEIRQFIDDESESGFAWIVDIMKGKECIWEGAGVAGILSKALREASDALAEEITREGE
jgi:hypothetical protein